MPDAPPKAARLKIETVAIDAVRPLERNARRGDVDAIRASLRRLGQYKPLVIRAETGEILVGNHTWQALREEGHEHVAVVKRSVPDDDEATRLALVDNRTR
jgi:ParB-like chromosome segregation protein Spo0J